MQQVYESESKSILDMYSDGGPMFHLLSIFFVVWVGFAIFTQLPRAKERFWLLGPVVILPQCLIAGGVLLYFVSFRMLTDTLGTTGDRLDWVILHFELQNEIVCYSAFIVGVGVLSFIIGWCIALKSFTQVIQIVGANKTSHLSPDRFE